MKNKLTALLLIFTLVSFTSLSLAQSLQPYILKDINPGSQSSHGMNSVMTVVLGDKLLFAANDGVYGEELWVSDGTHEGTQLLKDIYPGPVSSWIFQSEDLVYNGKFYFVARDGIHGFELWVTDGTPEGTQMIKDINPGPVSTYNKNFKGFNGLMYFEANDTYWVTDGTEAGTQMIKDIELIYGQIEYNNKLYFGTSDGSGFKLWTSDGTEAGTQMIKDINLLSNNGFIEYNGKLYFRADNGNLGYELWATDGTEAGTEMVKDIYTGSNNSDIRSFTLYDDKLFFVAKNGNGR